MAWATPANIDAETCRPGSPRTSMVTGVADSTLEVKSAGMTSSAARSPRATEPRAASSSVTTLTLSSRLMSALAVNPSTILAPISPPSWFTIAAGTGSEVAFMFPNAMFKMRISTAGIASRIRSAERSREVMRTSFQPMLAGRFTRSVPRLAEMCSLTWVASVPQALAGQVQETRSPDSARARGRR